MSSDDKLDDDDTYWLYSGVIHSFILTLIPYYYYFVSLISSIDCPYKLLIYLLCSYSLSLLYLFYVMISSWLFIFYLDYIYCLNYYSFYNDPKDIFTC